MNPRIVAAVASVPVVSYAVILSAAFTITAVSGSEPISITSQKLLTILMKSVSLPVLALYVVSLLPVLAVPFLLSTSSRKSALGVMTVGRWMLATSLVSIIPSIFSVIIADNPAQGLMIGFGAGLVSVVVFVLICSAANQKIADNVSTQPMRLAWDERYAQTQPDPFGKRGVT